MRVLVSIGRLIRLGDQTDVARNAVARNAGLTIKINLQHIVSRKIQLIIGFGHLVRAETGHQKPFTTYLPML